LFLLQFFIIFALLNKSFERLILTFETSSFFRRIARFSVDHACLHHDGVFYAVYVDGAIARSVDTGYFTD